MPVVANNVTEAHVTVNVVEAPLVRRVFVLALAPMHDLSTWLDLRFRYYRAVRYVLKLLHM